MAQAGCTNWLGGTAVRSVVRLKWLDLVLLALFDRQWLIYRRLSGLSNSRTFSRLVVMLPQNTYKTSRPRLRPPSALRTPPRASPVPENAAVALGCLACGDAVAWGYSRHYGGHLFSSEQPRLFPKNTSSVASSRPLTKSPSSSPLSPRFLAARVHGGSIFRA